MKTYVNYKVKENQDKVCNRLKFFWSSQVCEMGVLVKLHSILFLFYITKTVRIEGKKKKEKMQQYWHKNR